MSMHFSRLFLKEEMLCLTASDFLEITTRKLKMKSLKSEQMELIRDRSSIFMYFWLLDGFPSAPISYECIEVRVMLTAYYWFFRWMSFAPYVIVSIDGQRCVIYEF